MFKVFGNILKIPDLRKRFFFTMVMLVLFRVGVQLPVPGVNIAVLLSSKTGGANPLMDLLDLFSGGGLSRASIFSLGVMPYITSMIVMQLLTAMVPSLNKMQKEGPEGRKKFRQYGRYGTIAVTILQGMIYGRHLIQQSAADPNPFLTMAPAIFIFVFILSVTAGSLILMWMGEQVTERGIGNGISLLIMAGIIARMPTAVYSIFKSQMDPINLLVVMVFFFGVIALVVFEEMGLRRIPVQYAKRFVGSGAYSGQASYIPFKVNPTGVIPIIFASSLLIIPAQLYQWFPKVKVFQTISNAMLPGHAWYSVIYFLLIIFFAYFYMEIELNPHDIAENLRRQSGFIPGIRPGEKTEEHISYVLNRITLPGAIFLGAIALVPSMIINLMGIPSSLGYLMGGTSLLIMVGVALETLRQLESHLMMHHMDGFLSKNKHVSIK